ncbi:hypothetical protein BJ138DRAFT_1177075 [Hygrophoropsis aurantiaca]|uniref:Uncharacterized protein n=1 Tax=Hygrophoropsis aurantiaca TaxID=72124 RepID=A0ACB8ANJ4_9AGAM|nr:hypothetical protein BJ138DRAFT_1177075 [Hygrophoropsis aurantiaca]
MSALKFAVSALNREKPHSSITDWVEILTSPAYDDEAYDGIPELVDSIGLQPTGPAEASRAIRKKIKHGDSHHQYRALVILKALVENGGHKFQTNFADGQLTDAIKQLASDPTTDPKVKKKLLAVLLSWSNQFKNDPAMSIVSGLYRQCRPAERRTHGYSNSTDVDRMWGEDPAEIERRKREKEEKELKKRAKQAKEETKQKARKMEEDGNRRQSRSKRAPFNFEQEKPKILTSIANASQASSNLVNAIMLVNSEKENVITNERVQQCLANAKTVRKPIVRYIQIVENEEIIGALIETNERIIAAMQMYDNISAANPSAPADSTTPIETALAGTHITDPSGSGELTKLQLRQRAEVARARQRTYDDDEPNEYDIDGNGPYVHPDLQDLSFGPLGSEQNRLPPPLRPSAHHSASIEPQWDRGRGSLSDFSDYDSEEEGRTQQASHVAGPSTRTSGNPVEAEDPFADPFAD